ncbi:MAG: hypothetical protein JJLCMIEE_03294 [Acidimicrobiales bacterium]|nr:hypothetical protein [Acidimicrobiales bacterium]
MKPSSQGCRVPGFVLQSDLGTTSEAVVVNPAGASFVHVEQCVGVMRS